MKQKKERVSIKNYQKLAMRTCMKSCRNKDYAYWGHKSEYAELESKLYGFKAKKIRGDSEEKLAELKHQIVEELGDCFWFVALKCTLAKKPFEKLYKCKETDANGAVEIDLKQYIECLKSWCRIQKITPLKCMQMNINKLASRKERGKITGNGDER